MPTLGGGGGSEEPMPSPEEIGGEGEESTPTEGGDSYLPSFQELGVEDGTDNSQF